MRRYDGTGSGEDVANALTVDDSGNVYVTGYSTNGINYDFATIKYSPNGASLWVRRYDGPGNGSDQADALVLDSDGNLYVTGWSVVNGGGADYNTIKYAANGDTLWVRRYTGPGNFHEDGASALAVDASGNVYVTGRSVGSDTSFDYATIKYSSAGDTLWVRRYTGPGNFFDEASALAVDVSGNVYVTGRSDGTGFFDYDYATIKYSSAGDTLWVRRYTGPGNSDDDASALAVDASGNVYVTGRSVGSDTSFDYATIKYNSFGDTLWVRRYNGLENGFDEASALAVDDSGNVYVTGESDGTGTFDYDYATIKYVQFACVDTAGDANGDGKVTLPDIITLVNHIFKGAPKPDPACRGDANADGKITLPDIIVEVNYVFKGGPKPLKSKECCL